MLAASFDSRRSLLSLSLSLRPRLTTMRPSLPQRPERSNTPQFFLLSHWPEFDPPPHLHYYYPSVFCNARSLFSRFVFFLHLNLRLCVFTSPKITPFQEDAVLADVHVHAFIETRVLSWVGDGCEKNGDVCFESGNGKKEA
jgi:hypothetical protein